MPIITTRRSSTPIQTQCQKPHGWLGRYSLWRMNISHSKLTDWGLQHVSIAPHFTILDVGCGGGRTVSKLAALAQQGKVFGVDFSDASVAASKKTNAPWIASGRVEIREGSVSQLPFPDATFDLITAVETHFWWPNLPGDIREVFRVTKPGGTVILIAEIYKGANTMVSKMFEKHGAQLGATLLSVDEHRELLASAGFSDVQAIEQRAKGWICAMGKKPATSS
jgi:ubiquinone/menaquinone biosynthesis C-methylase UbiE